VYAHLYGLKVRRKENDKKLEDLITFYPKITHGQKEIGEYIQSLGFNIIFNDRKTLNPFELDILIPSKNVAIEYNGNYWHSEDRLKTIKYHQNKSLLA
jgi:hypothetical protein